MPYYIVKLLIVNNHLCIISAIEDNPSLIPIINRFGQRECIIPHSKNDLVHENKKKNLLLVIALSFNS